LGVECGGMRSDGRGENRASTLLRLVQVSTLN
jgi:hypothetical protein